MQALASRRSPWSSRDKALAEGANPLLGGSVARSAGEPGSPIIGHSDWRVSRYVAAPRDRGDDGIVIRDKEHADRQSPAEVVRGLRRVDDPMQGRAPSIVGPAHHQIAEIDRERVIYDRHRHPATRTVHNLEAPDIVVAVKQRHHAEVAVRAGPQLTGQRGGFWRWIVHDAQLADVIVYLPIEKFRRQFERLGEDPA